MLHLGMLKAEFEVLLLLHLSLYFLLKIYSLLFLYIFRFHLLLSLFCLFFLLFLLSFHLVIAGLLVRSLFLFWILLKRVYAIRSTAYCPWPRGDKLMLNLSVLKNVLLVMAYTLMDLVKNWSAIETTQALFLWKISI